MLYEQEWSIYKTCRSSKFMLFSNKKVKTYWNTKHPTKDQVKTYKSKMSQWINDNKSVYIRTRDLAYNLNCYSNLGEIKADKFRKNLGISNNQSVRREREIFAAESMADSTKLILYLIKLICVFLFIN